MRKAPRRCGASWGSHMYLWRARRDSNPQPSHPKFGGGGFAIVRHCPLMPDSSGFLRCEFLPIFASVRPRWCQGWCQRTEVDQLSAVQLEPMLVVRTMSVPFRQSGSPIVGGSLPRCRGSWAYETQAIRPTASCAVPICWIILCFHVRTVPYSPISFHRIAAIFAATTQRATLDLAHSQRRL
jgi:hypothetical protein